jgi:hypothetical protein
LVVPGSGVAHRKQRCKRASRCDETVSPVPLYHASPPFSLSPISSKPIEYGMLLFHGRCPWLVQMHRWRHARLDTVWRLKRVRRRGGNGAATVRLISVVAHAPGVPETSRPLPHCTLRYHPTPGGTNALVALCPGVLGSLHSNHEQ